MKTISNNPERLFTNHFSIIGLTVKFFTTCQTTFERMIVEGELSAIEKRDIFHFAVVDGVEHQVNGHIEVCLDDQMYGKYIDSEIARLEGWLIEHNTSTHKLMSKESISQVEWDLKKLYKLK
jgi:hypothetical protein